MPDNQHEPQHVNGVRREGVGGSAVPLGRHGAHSEAAAEADYEQIDLVAVQADDELINALSAGLSVQPPAPSAGYPADDQVAAILAAWKAEVDAEPIPELVDVDTAVATIKAARRRRAGRARHLVPVAAAAAVLVLTMGGVSVGSYSAEPDDALWSVSKVLFSERAASVEAADRVEGHIERAKQALVAGQPAVAEQELARAKADLGAVRPEEGAGELAEVQDFLMVKAQETPPGAVADLDAPLTTQPKRPVPPRASAPAPDTTSNKPSGPGTKPAPSSEDESRSATRDPRSSSATRDDPRLAPEEDRPSGTSTGPTSGSPVPPEDSPPVQTLPDENDVLATTSPEAGNPSTTQSSRNEGQPVPETGGTSTTTGGAGTGTGTATGTGTRTGTGAPPTS